MDLVCLMDHLWYSHNITNDPLVHYVISISLCNILKMCENEIIELNRIWQHVEMCSPDILNWNIFKHAFYEYGSKDDFQFVYWLVVIIITFLINIDLNDVEKKNFWFCSHFFISCYRPRSSTTIDIQGGVLFLLFVCMMCIVFVSARSSGCVVSMSGDTCLDVS